MVTQMRFRALMLRLSGMGGVLLVTAENSEYRGQISKILGENNVDYELRIMERAHRGGYGNTVLDFYLFDLKTGIIYESLSEIEEFAQGVSRAA